MAAFKKLKNNPMHSRPPGNLLARSMSCDCGFMTAAAGCPCPRQRRLKKGRREIENDNDGAKGAVGGSAKNHRGRRLDDLTFLGSSPKTNH
ncbi:hypothetical protein JJB99_14770 [Bradyrhizobium diazoefficiens]|uniref:hypothetical protein n=1 Tax=Bradyrhizobium diazoefficiens TaxID=1355477 RepID=UPI00190A697D|nr:hypothetical protein [Bradyrhizobium diazoefficiens]QQO17308.1 hypothetical protein JJB99_14770 [Bradyrhizobium diazoefficiens]